MRVVIDVSRPWSLLAILCLTVGFIAWTVSVTPPAGERSRASVGGDSASVQEDLRSAEGDVRRQRQTIAVIERKEEILRFQLASLEDAQRRLQGVHAPELAGELASAREHLLSLLRDKRAAEEQLRTSLAQVWEAEERGGRIGAGLRGAVASLAWPVDPALGLSAKFLDPEYEEHFGLPHYAIDIPVLQGSPIHAAADGTVEAVADNGYGYSYLILKHKGVATLYGHVQEFLVTEGQQVKQGEEIALSGGSPGTRGAGALSTGPHVHFETIVDGERVDPLTLLPDHPAVQ